MKKGPGGKEGNSVAPQDNATRGRIENVNGREKRSHCGRGEIFRRSLGDQKKKKE